MIPKVFYSKYIRNFERFIYSHFRLKVDITPPRFFVLSFIFLILAGTLLLMEPFLSVSGKATSWDDALFIATSSVCVTGLSTLDVSQHYNRWGQSVMLCLFQLGGLGMMLFTSSLILMFGGRLGLKGRKMLQEQVQGLSMSGTSNLVKYALVFVLGTETLGAMLLFWGWKDTFHWQDALFYAVFHSISGFCNAGFSTFSDNLTGFKNDPIICGTISLMIIMGGLGFLVFTELIARISKHNDHRHISLHTKIVLWTTFILIFGGALLFAYFERDNPQVVDGWNTVTVSLFQSVTCRTAGFNSVDLLTLHEETRQLMIALMFIGAAPGSTAGGVKVTTFALIVLATFTQLRGKKHVVISGRKIPWLTVLNAVALLTVATACVFVITTVLNMFEDDLYNYLLFETVSALGTVGLSLNVTPNLCTTSKLVLCLTMFLGRVGPLTLATSFIAASKQTSKVDYPESDIILG